MFWNLHSVGQGSTNKGLQTRKDLSGVELKKIVVCGGIIFFLITNKSDLQYLLELHLLHKIHYIRNLGQSLNRK